jgi:hypothetical protein
VIAVNAASENLACIQLDGADEAQATAAVTGLVKEFGRIDGEQDRLRPGW